MYALLMIGMTCLVIYAAPAGCRERELLDDKYSRLGAGGAEPLFSERAFQNCFFAVTAIRSVTGIEPRRWPAFDPSSRFFKFNQTLCLQGFDEPPVLVR
jgi:hypothetical protein